MDENNLYRRVKRYGGVSRTVGGLAVKAAGTRLFGLDVDKGQHSRALKLALGDLKGPLMKAAQTLATIPGVLPQEYADELRELQSNAPPMSWAFVRRRMKAELGADWQAKFASFDKAASAAASLGQVHKAVGHDGQALACKLQYADMASAVAADVAQLKLALKAYRAFDKAIDASQLVKEVTDRLWEELDYKLEAKHIKLFAYIFAQDYVAYPAGSLQVPCVVADLSSDKLLTMNWLDGQGLMSWLKTEPSQERRDQVARSMFFAWNRPIYGFGIVHGDPHLGNYSFDEDDKLNLLDFGCVRKFPASFIGGAVDLYKSKVTQDEELAVHAFEAWGFKGLKRETLDTLNTWADFLYAPVLQDKKLKISESNSIEQGAKIVQDVHKSLREQGGVTVPREFVFMDRAAVGLGSVYIHLGAALNWHQLFNEVIDDFTLGGMQERQTQAMAAAGLDKVMQTSESADV